jgi:hypothetical protein
MADDDGFEAKLTDRLRAATDVLGAPEPPIAELRRAGGRRARARRTRQLGALTAVVALTGLLSWSLSAVPVHRTAVAPAAASGEPSPGPSATTGSPPSPGWLKSGCPGSTPSADAPSPSASISEHEFTEEAFAVSQLGKARYGDVYSVVCDDWAHRTIYVYRLPGATAFDQAVRAQVRADVAVRFVDATYTWFAVTDMIKRITADKPYWQERGVSIQAVGDAAPGSGVEVDVADGAETLLPQMVARYGPMVVSVVNRVIVAA